MATLSFLVEILFLVMQKSNLQFLYLVASQNTRLWPTRLLRLFRSFVFYVIFMHYLLIDLCCYVVIKVNCSWLKIQSLTDVLNTVIQIITLFENLSLQGNYILSLFLLSDRYIHQESSASSVWTFSCNASSSSTTHWLEGGY